MIFSKLPKNVVALLPYFLATPFVSFTAGANLALATIASKELSWSATDFSYLFILASVAAIIMAIYLPKLLDKHSIFASPLFLIIISVLSYIPLSYYPDIYLLWACVFFVRAYTASALCFLIEANFICKLDPNQRARGVTAYFVFAVLGFMLSPLLYAEIGMTFLSILFAPVSLLIVWCLLRNRIDVKSQIIETPRISDFWEIFKIHPVLWMICIVGGMASESVDAFLGVFALDIGYTTKESLSLMSWFFFGGLLLQYPLSHWMDHSVKMRFTVRLILFTALWSTLIAFISSSGYWPLSLSLAFWGGLCYTIGVASLALVGDKFTGQQRVIAVALQSALYHAGCLIGPIVLGFSLENYGGEAVPLSFAVVCIILLLIRKALPRNKQNALDIKPIWGVSLPLLIQMKKEEIYAEPKERSPNAS